MEYVSSGKSNSSLFPDSRQDKEGILYWLHSHGYEELKGKIVQVREMLEYYKKTGNGCFCMSTYDREDPLTHWIRIYDGKKIFTIRTCRESFNGEVFSDCSVIFNPTREVSMSKPVSFKEIKLYFDNGNTW
jgi:hypothetical protein